MSMFVTAILSLQLVQKDTTGEILSKTRRLLVENKF
jgi:hypothetical protein